MPTPLRIAGVVGLLAVAALGLAALFSPVTVADVELGKVDCGSTATAAFLDTPTTTGDFVHDAFHPPEESLPARCKRHAGPIFLVGALATSAGIVCACALVLTRPKRRPPA